MLNENDIVEFNGIKGVVIKHKNNLLIKTPVAMVNTSQFKYNLSHKVLPVWDIQKVNGKTPEENFTIRTLEIELANTEFDRTIMNDIMDIIKGKWRNYG